MTPAERAKAAGVQRYAKRTLPKGRVFCWESTAEYAGRVDSYARSVSNRGTVVSARRPVHDYCQSLADFHGVGGDLCGDDGGFRGQLVDRTRRLEGQSGLAAFHRLHRGRVADFSGWGGARSRGHSDEMEGSRGGRADWFF